MKSAVFGLAAFTVQLWCSTPAPAQDGQRPTAGAPRESNPAISANGLFLGGYTKREEPNGASTSRTGLYLQQMEVQLEASVDAGLRAVLTFSLPSARGAEGGWSTQEISIAEGFMTTELSGDLLLKAGKFYADFGQHNLLHAHQFPFLDPPLVLERLFGEDGIDEVGIGLRWSLPTSWRTALSTQVLNGDNPLWVNPTDEDLLYLAHLGNAWSVGAADFELGGSWASGRNPSERYTHALGGDLTVDWHMGPGRARGFTWQTEYMLATADLRVERHKRGGMYSLLQYQFGRRWWAQGRYDKYGLPADKVAGREDRFSGLLAFVPSVFSAVRFQYSRWRVDRAGRGYNQYHIQCSFGIGSHPAQLWLWANRGGRTWQPD